MIVLVDSANDSMVFDDPLRHMTPVGAVFPEGRKVLVTSTVCVLLCVILVPSQRAVTESSMLDIYFGPVPSNRLWNGSL